MYDGEASWPDNWSLSDIIYAVKTEHDPNYKPGTNMIFGEMKS